MPSSDTTSPASGRRTGYVVKVYPRFSETFIVTEILAREDAGDDLEIFALRPTTDTRFHPEIARVRAPVTHIGKPYKLSDAWQTHARAVAVIPGFAERWAELLPELAEYDASDVHQAIELACAAHERGITHLHAHFGSLSGRTAEIAALLAGIGYSVTTHAKDLFHESVDADRLGRTIRRAHHIVTISEYNLAHLHRSYPESADAIRLVYNGLELARFPYADPREPAVPARPLRIAAVGRMVEKKGFPDLVSATGRLRDAGVPVSVRIAGEGELFDSLSREIEAAGLTGDVELLGACTQEEIRSLLGWADVFSAPSVVGADGNADGLPTVLLEAMASGVPCVASTVTGIPEAIIDDVTGLLHAPGDVDGLVAALTAVADPSFDRVALARAARTFIEERFDSRKQARALMALEDAACSDVPAPVRDLSGVRIAYVSVDPGVPVHGTKGASVHVQEVVRELVARGADVTMFATRVGDAMPADLAGVDLVHVPMGTRDAAEREAAQHAVSARFADRIVEEGFDLVYERCSLFSTTLERAATAGIPGILEVNAPLIDEQRTHRVLVDEALAQQCLRRQVRAAARTIAVSRPVADWIRAAVDGAEVLVVPNGVDTERIVPADEPGARRGNDVAGGAAGGRGGVGRGSGRPRVAFVGTLKPWHGVDTLIDAAELAAEEWEVVIIGDGPQGEALRARVAAAGLASRVSFTGAVAPAEVGPLLAACDLAAAPYPAAADEDSYFSPLKIYEYLAAGLPVVGSAVGQVPEILARTDAGVLVAPSDPQALADALDALAADPARRRSMGRAARELAVERHSWASAVDSILDGVVHGSGTVHGAGAMPRASSAVPA